MRKFLTLEKLPSRFIDTNGIRGTLMNTRSKRTFVNVNLAFRAFKARRTGTMVRTITNASIFTAGFAYSWKVEQFVSLVTTLWKSKLTYDNNAFRCLQSLGCICTGKSQVLRNCKWHWSDRGWYLVSTGWLACMTNPRHPFEILRRIHLQRKNRHQCILFCRRAFAWLNTVYFLHLETTLPCIFDYFCFEWVMARHGIALRCAESCRVVTRQVLWIDFWVIL